MRLTGSLTRLIRPSRDRQQTLSLKRAQTTRATQAGARVLNLAGGESIDCVAAPVLPLSPESLRVGLGYPSLALPPAKMYVLRSARICPGSRVVMAADGRVVAESLSVDLIDRFELIASEVRTSPIHLEGVIALYQSPRIEPYHGLIDHLPRAALFAQPLVRRFGKVTLLHEGPFSDLDELWLSRLAGPSVTIKRVEAGSAYTADQVLLPGYVTRPHAGAVPAWYRRWIDGAASALPAVSKNQYGTRRYFVDRLAGGRTVENREEFEEFMERHGITAVAPSSLDLKERIATFRDADLVLGATGSGLSNLLFSRRAQVIEILPGSKMFPHTFYLCQSRSLGYHYAKAHLEGPERTEVERLAEPVRVDIEALEHLMSKLTTDGALAN